MDGASDAGLVRDRLLLGAVLLGALGHLAIIYPGLPERVPTHFDTAGAANGYMSRDAFAWTMSATYLLLGAGFLLLPRLIAHVPAAFVNLPNREYWLAPERRAATLVRLSRSLVRFGAVNVVFVLLLVHATAEVARGESETLRGFLPALAVYGLYTAFWCIALVRGFRLPRDARPTDRGRDDS